MADPRPIVLVTGGREYRDMERVSATLTEIGPGLVIEGGAEGADALARGWARAHGVHTVQVAALWYALGRAAGPRRNAVMVELARRLGARVVAFPGGRGTADCVAKARAAGLDVLVVEEWA